MNTIEGYATTHGTLSLRTTSNYLVVYPEVFRRILRSDPKRLALVESEIPLVRRAQARYGHTQDGRQRQKVKDKHVHSARSANNE